MKKVNPTDAFVQGYICAVCALIKMNGYADSQATELYRAGIGNKTVEELMASGVNSNDIEIIQQNWSILYGT